MTMINIRPLASKSDAYIFNNKFFYKEMVLPKLECNLVELKATRD